MNAAKALDRRVHVSSGRCERGMSLVELVMAIVIVSAALSGVLLTFDFGTARSADPMLQTQAQSVARAYLEEIIGQAYDDPDGNESGEVRATFDDVDDYHALSNNGCVATSSACPSLGDCACDQLGQPVDELPDYVVAVTVSNTTLGAVAARRVDVLVTHAVNPDLRVNFSGYRTSY